MGKVLSPDGLLYKLSRMNVPPHRIKTNRSNLEWLKNNLAERNSEHPDYSLVIESINHMIETKQYTN